MVLLNQSSLANIPYTESVLSTTIDAADGRFVFVRRGRACLLENKYISVTQSCKCCRTFFFFFFFTYTNNCACW